MKFIQERNLIVSKLLQLKNSRTNLSNMDIDFLINYFQTQEDVERTYIYYPVKIAGAEITFKRGMLFGKNQTMNLEKILTTDIVGMMYFYARFNKDMTFGSSEKLRVNLFLDPEKEEVDMQKNISYIKNLNAIHSPLLQKICKKYIAAAS